MFILIGKNSRDKVECMCKYMSLKGLVFSTVNLDDSSPYGILMGGSSVGYRTRSKWGQTGIVLFCTPRDAELITKRHGIKTYENNDSIRPYVIFVTEDEFELVVPTLALNGENKARVKPVTGTYSNSTRTRTSYAKTKSSSKKKNSKSILKSIFRGAVSFGTYVGSESRRTPIAGVRRNRKRRK